MGRLGHAGDVVEDFKNTLGTGGGFLGVRDDAAHRIQPRVKAPDVSQEGRQHTHRNLVMRDQVNTKAPDHQQTHFGHQRDCGREQ